MKPSKRLCFFLSAICFAVASTDAKAAATSNQIKYENEIIRKGHSHNDYLQESPLESALRHGMRSIEVDVFPMDNKLLVGHTRFELDPTLDIDGMYIKPLHRILQGKKFNSINKKGDDIKHRNLHIPLISRRGGDGNPFRRSWSRRRNPIARYIYNNSNSETVLSPYDESLILLVDFKCDPNLSAKLLDKSIELLKPYLSRVEQGKFVKGKMTVVISGNRPKNRFLFSTTGTTAKSNNQTSFFRGGGSDGEIDAIRGKFSWQQNLIRRFSQPIVNNDNDDLTRYMFLDGRIGDLNTEQDSELVPLVSFDWKMIQLFRYFNGNSEEFLKRIADRAHSQGKRMRIWGAPNTEQCWSSMLKSNVDWLSVDDHERFTEFATHKSRLLKLE